MVVLAVVRHLSSTFQQAYHCFLLLLLFLAVLVDRQHVAVNVRSGFQADYCQIELHILSHFSSDQSLLAAFHRVGFDVLFKAIAVS